MTRHADKLARLRWLEYFSHVGLWFMSGMALGATLVGSILYLVTI